MAQLQSNLPQSLGEGALPNTYSEKEMYELQQYNRIIRFRNTVLSGEHGKVRLPESVAPTEYTPAFSTSRLQLEDGEITATNESVPSTDAPAPAIASSVGKKSQHSIATSPVLFKKSDELILTEIQLQRQRIEQSLKDDLEQSRAPKHDHADLSGFEVSEVLAKALAIAQPIAVTPICNDSPIADSEDCASDSFDENTFYSSHHDTPESRLAALVRNESEDIQNVRESASYEPEQMCLEAKDTYNKMPPATREKIQPLNEGYAIQSVDIPGLGGTSVFSASMPVPVLVPPPKPIQVPGLNNYANAAVPSGQTSLYNSSGEHSQSGDSGVMEVDQHGRKTTKDTERQLDDTHVVDHPPSPLVRGHDSMPVASQFASAPNPGVKTALAQNAGRNAHVSIGTPAQVSALRKEPASAASTNSSSGTSKDANKKKDRKKKKRKADRQAPDEYEAYIKPEPRSSSPVSTPALVRPSKRQKQAQRPGNVMGQAGPPLMGAAQPHYDPHAHPNPIQIAYAPPLSYPQQTTNRTITKGSRPGVEGGDDGRIHLDSFYRRPSSARSSTYYHADLPQAPRSFSGVATDNMGGPSRYYQAGRMSVMPETETYDRQTRPQPTRIYVDAFGREYLEPPRPVARPPTVLQQTEPDVVYERTVPREVPRHPVSAGYDDSSIMYARSSSAYPPVRRVVTQPEYAMPPPEFRDMQQRESSIRPMAPPTEFVRYMPAPERMAPVEVAPREYVARPPSVRPIEPQRYEPQKSYVGVHSTRYEPPVREYRASVHPESQRDLPPPPPPQYMMGYEPRPVEHHSAPGGYPVRSIERHYGQPVHGGGDGFAFAERPRGTIQEIAYADDGRQELHR